MMSKSVFKGCNEITEDGLQLLFEDWFFLDFNLITLMHDFHPKKAAISVETTEFVTLLVCAMTS